MARTPKALPQTMEEMTAAAAMTKRSKVYSKEDTLVSNESRISDAVENLAEGLENIVHPQEKILLSDVDDVQRITVQYVKACARASSLPTMSGLAKALGHSRQALYDYRKRKPNSPTAEWLEEVSDSFGETMMNYALNGTVAAVPAIFVAKARYMWRDALTIEVPKENPLGDAIDPSIIEERYRCLPDD